VERAERCGPVGYGKPGIVAGDEASGDEQKKGGAGEEQRERVMRTVVMR
jgi:hypothetical protein